MGAGVPEHDTIATALKCHDIQIELYWNEREVGPRWCLGE